MSTRLVVLSVACAALAACPAPSKCEGFDASAPGPQADAGLPPDAGAPQDAGATADAGVEFAYLLRFVNLGREAVTVRFDGEDGGLRVERRGTGIKRGHVTLIKRTGFVDARDFLPDGGARAVTLPFDFDTTTDAPQTFVLKDTTPARLSTNFTVGKQTQGATFGERINAGLAGVDIEGGVDTGGDCNAELGGDAGVPARVSVREDTTQACDASQDATFRVEHWGDPHEYRSASPYFARGSDGELELVLVRDAVPRDAPTGQASGKSGFSIGEPGVQRALRALYVLNAHASRQPATVTVGSVVLAANVAPGALVRVPAHVWAQARIALNGLPPGEPRGLSLNGLPPGVPFRFTVSVGDSAQPVEVEAPQGGPCDPPFLCDSLLDEDTLLVVSENLGSSATVLKTKHDTVKNSINNVRAAVVFGTTSTAATNACVAVHAADDTCVMGAAQVPAAAVSAVGGLVAIGGAAAASYAATGRLLYPPKNPPAMGSTMRFGIAEPGGQRVFWDSPGGLTPRAGKQPGGFAIVAAGSALSATAQPTQRALFFVDTTVAPWTVSGTLSTP